MRDALWLRAFVAATCLLMPQLAHAQATSYEQLQTFSSVLSQVRTNYMDSVETGYLVRGAITGMLERLDPHSHYTSRADFELRAAWMAGQLGTPGIYFEDGDGGPVVLSVRRESPAWKAGVQPGDRLVAINDTVVGNMNAQAAELRMIGEKGSRVKLKLARGSTGMQGPSLSPDGRHLVYRTTALNTNEVWVRPLNGETGELGAPTRVGEGLGMTAWRGDGAEIYYVGPARELMAASVRTSPTLAIGEPRRLFDLPSAIPLAANFDSLGDVSVDGGAVVVAVPPTVTMSVSADHVPSSSCT